MTGSLPLYRPMLAVPARPEEIPPRWAGQDWIEVKWDGYRCLVYVDRGRATLRSRGLKDLSPWFPELRHLASQVKATRAVLDGELVAFAEGRPSFSHLQARVGGLPWVRRGEPANVNPSPTYSPVTFIAFDALHLDDEPLVHLPLRERYNRLAGAIETGGPLQLSRPLPATEQPAGEDAVAEAAGALGPVKPREPATPIARALAAARRLGLEGVVAKDPSSPYLAGQRSPFWRKLKVRKQIPVRVVGFTARDGHVKALLVASVAPPFTYLGRVGTGLTERQRRILYHQLQTLERPRSPLPTVPEDVPEDARWISPEVICWVEYLEISPQGRLRHPSFAGWAKEAEWAKERWTKESVGRVET